eukprot:746060-Hanusia_phi.AAC.3
MLEHVRPGGAQNWDQNEREDLPGKAARSLRDEGKMRLAVGQGPLRLYWSRVTSRQQLPTSHTVQGSAAEELDEGHSDTRQDKAPDRRRRRTRGRDPRRQCSAGFVQPAYWSCSPAAIAVVTSTEYFWEAVKGMGYFLFAGSSVSAMPDSLSTKPSSSSDKTFPLPFYLHHHHLLLLLLTGRLRQKIPGLLDLRLTITIADNNRSKLAIASHPRHKSPTQSKRTSQIYLTLIGFSVSMTMDSAWARKVGILTAVPCKLS